MGHFCSLLIIICVEEWQTNLIILFFYAVANYDEELIKTYRSPVDNQSKELFLPFRCFCTRKDVSFTLPFHSFLNSMHCVGHTFTCRYMHTYYIKNISDSNAIFTYLHWMRYEDMRYNGSPSKIVLLLSLPPPHHVPSLVS